MHVCASKRKRDYEYGERGLVYSEGLPDLLCMGVRERERYVRVAFLCIFAYLFVLRREIRKEDNSSFRLDISYFSSNMYFLVSRL